MFYNGRIGTSTYIYLDVHVSALPYAIVDG